MGLPIVCNAAGVFIPRCRWEYVLGVAMAWQWRTGGIPMSERLRAVLILLALATALGLLLWTMTDN